MGTDVANNGGAAASTAGSALEAWAGIAQAPELIEYFKGLFNRAAVTVEDTGEQFTVIHTGTDIQLAPGIQKPVDFHVPLLWENVSYLVEFSEDGAISPDESWRIICVLFTPLTQAALSNPIVAKNWLRKIAGVESLIHVHLLNPEGDDAAAHTLAFAGDQWLVLPGLHGKPERTYNLKPDAALEFQRHLFTTLKSDSSTAWWHFANWYRDWRTGVSVTGS
ncbi:MAG: hypothetical protein WDZ49_00300 [Litorilinea sp.]